MIYIEIHTKGYAVMADAVILAAPSDRAEHLRAMADRMTTPNATIREIHVGRVRQLAAHDPHILYGYQISQENDGLPVDALLSQCADRTVEDLDANWQTIAARLVGDR